MKKGRALCSYPSGHDSSTHLSLAASTMIGKWRGYHRTGFISERRFVRIVILQFRCIAIPPLGVALLKLHGLAGGRRRGVGVVAEGGVGDVAVPVYHRVEGERLIRGGIVIVGAPLMMGKVSGKARGREGQIT